jgi:hypothetical protein
MLIRLIICIFGIGLLLYAYIDKQNDVTDLKIQIPKLSKELKEIREENLRLHYIIDRFENPQHLIELSRLKEFSHLKFPLDREVVILPKEEGRYTQTTSKIGILTIPKLSQFDDLK